MEGITRAMVRISGVSPLLMHSCQLVDASNPYTKKIKAITNKTAKKRTDTDALDLIELEFNGSLYFDDGIGPFLPGTNLEGAIRDGARTERKGKDIESGFVVEQDMIPLQYDGPRTREGLYENKRFVDFRVISLPNKSKLMRTRPRFDNWSAEFEIMCIDELLSIKDVERFISIAGRVKGLCDYRPKFGRFVVDDFVIV